MSPEKGQMLLVVLSRWNPLGVYRRLFFHRSCINLNNNTWHWQIDKMCPSALSWWRVTQFIAAVVGGYTSRLALDTLSNDVWRIYARLPYPFSSQQLLSCGIHRHLSTSWLEGENSLETPDLSRCLLLSPEYASSQQDSWTAKSCG